MRRFMPIIREYRTLKEDVRLKETKAQYTVLGSDLLPAHPDVPSFLEFDDGRVLDMRLRNRFWCNFISPHATNDRDIFICNLCCWKGKWWRFPDMDIARCCLPPYMWDYIIKGPQDMHTLPIEFLRDFSKHTASQTVEQAFWRLAAMSEDPTVETFNKYYEWQEAKQLGVQWKVDRIKYKDVVYVLRYTGSDIEVRVANSKPKVIRLWLRAVLLYCMEIQDYAFSVTEFVGWCNENHELLSEKGKMSGNEKVISSNLQRLAGYGFLKMFRKMDEWKIEKREPFTHKYNLDTLEYGPRFDERGRDTAYRKRLAQHFLSNSASTGGALFKGSGPNIMEVYQNEKLPFIETIINPEVWDDQY